MSREQREPEPITNLRKMLDTALQWAHSTYGNSLEDVTYLLTAYDDCRAQLAAAELRTEELTVAIAGWKSTAEQLRTRAERAEAVVKAAEVFDAMVNDHGWSLGNGMDGIVTLSTMTPRTLSVAVTELMEAVRDLSTRDGQGGVMREHTNADALERRREAEKAAVEASREEMVERVAKAIHDAHEDPFSDEHKIAWDTCSPHWLAKCRRQARAALTAPRGCGDTIVPLYTTPVAAVVSEAMVEAAAYTMYDPKNRLRPNGKVLPQQYIDQARAGLTAALTLQSATNAPL